MTDRFFSKTVRFGLPLCKLLTTCLQFSYRCSLQQENVVIQPNVFPFTYELCQAKWSPPSLWLKRVAKHTFAHPVSGILYHVSLFIIIIFMIPIFRDSTNRSLLKCVADRHWVLSPEYSSLYSPKINMFVY